MLKKIVSRILRKLGYVIERVHHYPRPMIKFIKRIFRDKALIGVEIGVWNGGHAESILKTLNMKKLFLIDPYEEYEETTIKNRAIEQGRKEIDMLKEAEREAKERVSEYKNKVKWIKKKSEEAVKVFRNNSLDFVYIDGNHKYEYVKKDIELYYKKLKKGGIIGGDDFANKDISETEDVTRAVIEFVFKNNLKLKSYGGDWWIVK